MSDKFNIEIDAEFLEKFFQLANLNIPDQIELEYLKSVADIVQKKLDVIANSSIDTTLLDEVYEGDPTKPKTVLIVDDLGIITVQLEKLFQNYGFEVITSRELFDAIKKYKTRDFGYAVLDLFIPTEREGLILIEEIKKLSLICKINTKIIVMSASSKKEYIEKCILKGADGFVEKNQGWQDKIIKFCMKTPQPEI